MTYIIWLTSAPLPTSSCLCHRSPPTRQPADVLSLRDNLVKHGVSGMRPAVPGPEGGEMALYLLVLAARCRDASQLVRVHVRISFFSPNCSVALPVHPGRALPLRDATGAYTRINCLTWRS